MDKLFNKLDRDLKKEFEFIRKKRIALEKIEEKVDNRFDKFQIKGK